MATIVCQGLQTCVESQPNEPIALRLKLTSPKPQFSAQQPLELKSSCFLDANTLEPEEKRKNNFHIESKQQYSNPDRGGWSFLQDLYSDCKDAKLKEDEKAYVHPSMKSSSTKLSGKSLEMCTENLGSETGTDITEDSIFASSLTSPNSDKPADFPVRKEMKSYPLSGTKKEVRREFPPPLTTLTGSDSIQVNPEREDGRLVIKAIKTSSSKPCFHAERVDGRLRLSLLRDYTSDYDSEDENIDDENEQEDHEHQDDFDDDEDGTDEFCYREAVDDDKDIDVEAEGKMEKFQRLSRCKEREYENKRLLNWEPCWVATS